MVNQVLFDDEGVYGVAYDAEGSELFTLPYSGEVENWQSLVLELREGDFADYLASDLGCRLCSERLRTILQDHASPDDMIQWLNVEVRKGKASRPYAILHFTSPPDVLNKTKSIMAGDFVVKAVFSKDAIGQHQVFAYPQAGELKLFITDGVKRAIQSAKCTGMEISRCPVV